MTTKIKEIEESIKKLDEKEVIENIGKYSNTKLADMVIVYRYFGLYEKISIAAMEELGKRRIAGDLFEYEKYIDANLATLPKLEFKITDLQSIMKGLGVKGFVKK